MRLISSQYQVTADGADGKMTMGRFSGRLVAELGIRETDSGWNPPGLGAFGRCVSERTVLGPGNWRATSGGGQPGDT